MTSSIPVKDRRNHVSRTDLGLAVAALYFRDEVGLAGPSIGKPLEKLLVGKPEKIEVEPGGRVRKEQLQKLPQEGAEDFLEQLVVSHRALTRGRRKTRPESSFAKLGSRIEGGGQGSDALLHHLVGEEDHRVEGSVERLSQSFAALPVARVAGERGDERSRPKRPLTPF
jgi:hypothetical protein